MQGPSSSTPMDHDVTMEFSDPLPQPPNETEANQLESVTIMAEIPLEATSPEPALTVTGRPQRQYRMPAKYNDVPPEGPAPLAPAPAPDPQLPLIRRVILHVRDQLRTGMNRFGLLREYPYRPSYDPDLVVPLEQLSDSPTLKCGDDTSHTNTASFAPPWPFNNMSIFLLMEWMTTGSNQKSVGEVDRLAKEVLGAKEFNMEDLHDFSAQRESKRLDDSDSSSQESPLMGDGWLESNITISIPTGLPDTNGADFTVPGLHHRSLISVMKSALADIASQRFHFSPFKRIWKRPSGVEERIFDEMYTSDAWLDAHNTLQKQRNEPGCKLEKVILGLLFWSDSTHLTSFGTASVWPLYMYFANLSKYFRGKPGSGASHHVAYIPKVSIFCLFRELVHLVKHFLRFQIAFKTQ
jgi:Plavaka transposase